jgi:hypothetical protein
VESQAVSRYRNIYGAGGVGKRLYTVRVGALAQLGERRLCKPKVTGSIPVRSITRKASSHAGLRDIGAALPIHSDAISKPSVQTG